MKNPFLYEKVKEYIIDQIKDLSVGDRIPSRNEIMRTMRVTRTTVDRAISELIGEGYLYAIDGSGTYVAKKMIDKRGSDGKITSWGVILPNIVSDTYPEILRGVEDIAHENNINVIICNTDNMIEKQEKYINKLINSNVSGIIIVPAIIYTDGKMDAGYDKLIENHIPFVFCNRGVEGVKAPRVTSDNHYGEYIAVKHLIDRGYRRIAFISRSLYAFVEQRLEGYMAALFDSGIDIDERYIIISNEKDNQKAGYEAAKALLSTEELPDAIASFNDEVAYGAYQAVKERGFSIPKDIALIGYDDSPICSIMPINLTTMRYPKYESGAKAAEILLNFDESTFLNPPISVLFPQLVIREST